MIAVLLVLFGIVSAEVEVLTGRECQPGELAVYRLEFTTHWSRELFPKQYPETRPPAQWSKIVGKYTITPLYLILESYLRSEKSFLSLLIVPISIFIMGDFYASEAKRTSN